MADIEEQRRRIQENNDALWERGANLIRKAYYSKTGLSTPYKIWKDVNSQDNRISLERVKAWFRENVARTKPTGGAKNSFVAPYAHFEYQVDIFFITEKQLQNQEFPFGLSCIDIFSKYATVVPIKSRKHEEIMRGILKAFKDMGKQPEIIMTDPESALFKREVAEAFTEMSIQHIITQSSVHFAERFHRTFRGMLEKRLDYLKNRKVKMPEKTNPNIQWHTLIPEILAVYNNKNIHTATGLTPSEARKPSAEVDAKTSMEMRAKRGRRYPTIRVGDTVRVIRKKILGDKEFTGNFRAGEHEVLEITTNFGQRFYRLDDGREYIRSDIVKF